jgi:hypothetical protein
MCDIKRSLPICKTQEKCEQIGYIFCALFSLSNSAALLDIELPNVFSATWFIDIYHILI